MSTEAAIILIAVVSIACMLARPWRISEVWWACGGALLLVIVRLVSLRDARHAIGAGLDVYLFLAGMMLLSELARAEGVFDWVADIAAHHAQGSRSRLFVLIYLTGVLVTALLSNDATAVVLTPAVLAVVRKAKVPARPYVLACALIANAASFILPVSNPANLVVFGRNLPPLLYWLRSFLLPSLASVVITFVVLRFNVRSDLLGKIEDLAERARLSAQGKLALVGLALGCMALICASLFGVSLGMPTLVAGLGAVLLVTWRDRTISARVAKGVSWSVLPLVAGLFVIVAGLQNAGLLHFGLRAIRHLSNSSEPLANLSGAFAVGFVSNAMNNLPVALIGGVALNASHQSGPLAHSLLIGVDLGPNLSVTGSLATILWLIALRRENVEITVWEFLKIGCIAMPLALFGSILLVGI